MNPAVLNYLQNQQFQQNTPNQGQQPNSNQSGTSFNPFDNGIKAAIESARVSLDMTEKQQDKALRRSLLSFGEAYRNEPTKKGVMDNFGAIARSLGPAVIAHDEEEDLAFKENNNLANQILAYQAAEQVRQASEEERQWHRSHAENQLEEQKRYHDLTSDYQNRKLEQTNPSISIPSELTEMGLFPIDNKRDFTGYLKDKKSLGTILNEVNELEEDYTKFRKKTSNNIFDPMAPSGRFTNYAKNLTGRFINSKKLKEETAERETLNSKLNKFVISSERTLKGGGVMGPRLIELFKEQGIYPSLTDDTPEIFESKLKMLKEEIENSYKAANLSLQYKLHVDPSQVNDFENKLKGEQPQEKINPPINDSYKTYIGQKGYEVVQMKDENGQIREVPPSRVDAAIAERKWRIAPPNEVTVDE